MSILLSSTNPYSVIWKQQQIQNSKFKKLFSLIDFKCCQNTTKIYKDKCEGKIYKNHGKIWTKKKYKYYWNWRKLSGKKCRREASAAFSIFFMVIFSNKFFLHLDIAFLFGCFLMFFESFKIIYIFSNNFQMCCVIL